MTPAGFVSVTMIWTLFSGYNATLILAQILSMDESMLRPRGWTGPARCSRTC